MINPQNTSLRVRALISSPSSCHKRALTSGAKDGRSFLTHLEQCFGEGVADFSEDFCGEQIAPRTVLWLPAPFAILVAHGVWPTLALLVHIMGTVAKFKTLMMDSCMAKSFNDVLFCSLRV